MTQDQNDAIALIIPLIVKNNAGKVAIALRDAGYSKDYIPQPELEARLFQLYIANPDKFFELMKSIPWNPGEVETNKPEIRDALIKLVSSHSDQQISKDNWWPELITLLSVQAAQPEARKEMKCYQVGFLLFLAGIGIAIVLYLIFRR